MQTAKGQVRQMLNAMPEMATLNDIRYQLNGSLYSLYVRQQIELGLDDSRAGRVVSHEEVKKRYGHDQG